MYRFARSLTVSTLVLVCGGSAIGAGGTVLRFQPEPASSLPYTMTNDSSIQLTMGAMGTQQMTNDAVLELHLDVVAVGKTGDVTMDFMYDRFRIETQTFGQSMVFDSEDPAADGGSEEMREVFSKMTGQSIRVTVDERGRVGEVAGLDALFDGIAGEASSDPQAVPIMEMIRGSFSDEAIQGMMQQAFVVFPEKAVSPGDSWTGSVETNDPMVGGLHAAYTYRFEGKQEHLGKDSLRLDFDVALTHDGTNPLLDQLVQMFRAQGSEVEVALEMDDAVGSGTVWLEPESGVPIELALNQKMNVAINIEMSMGGEPQTMSMQMDVDTRTAMKLAR